MTEINTEWPLLLCGGAVMGHDYARPGATPTASTESTWVWPPWELQVLHALREHTGYILYMRYTHMHQPDQEAPADGAPEQILYHLLVFAEHHTPAQS